MNNTIHVVSESGGLGSFMAAYLTMQQGHDMRRVFCDVLCEDRDLYRFQRETNAFFSQHGVPFTRISAEMNIWQIQEHAKMQANSKYDPCSRIGKRELFKKWMRREYPNASEAVIVLGIDASEAHRTKDFQRNHAPYKVTAPLCDQYYSREDIIDVLHKIGIEPPRLYEWDFPHNNCGGFCVKAGQKQATMMLKHVPENYAWHEAKQEEMFKRMGFRKPTIRKTINGVQYYFSLKEWRELVESGVKPEGYNEGGCACF